MDTTTVQQQQERLRRVIQWAQRVMDNLEHRFGNRKRPVWFRPSSSGFSMVGLKHEAPQLGKSFRSIEKLQRGFLEEYDRHCTGEPGRGTPEKQLQSYLIRQALAEDRLLKDLNAASESTDQPATLYFATDELSLPWDEGKIVCDLLAVRRTADGHVPVIIELKSYRELKRLVEQVNNYAAIIDSHRDLFEELFDALLPFDVRLQKDLPCERWIVWPQKGDDRDPKADRLAELGMRLVGYEQEGAKFSFRVEHSSS